MATSMSYTKIDELGEGPRGKVRKQKYGEDIKAVKTIKINNREEMQKQKKVLMHSQKPRHTNIIKIFDIKMDKQFTEIFMEFCKKGNLEQYLVSENPALKRKVQIIADCSSAVEYLHKNQIVHGGIKMTNVLMQVDNCKHVVKLSDFGQAKQFTPEETRIQEDVTNPFTAPEQFQPGKPCRTSGDTFSLGLVFSVVLKYQVYSTSTQPTLESDITQDEITLPTEYRTPSFAERWSSRYKTFSHRIKSVKPHNERRPRALTNIEDWHLPEWESVSTTVSGGQTLIFGKELLISNQDLSIFEKCPSNDGNMAMLQGLINGMLLLNPDKRKFISSIKIHLQFLHKEEVQKGKCLNLLLIGRTGEGKSETGNAICGEKVFHSSDGTKSSTRNVQSHTCNYGGYQINVVDTPGCIDTERGDAILFDLAKVITIYPEGYDAILFVTRYPCRWTDEYQKVLQQLEQIFGPDLFRFCVLVFTHGDYFKGKTFDDYVSEVLTHTGSGTMGHLLKKVEGRAVLFDNRNEGKRDLQVHQLIEIITNKIKQRYTDEFFEKARDMKKKKKADFHIITALVQRMKEKFSIHTSSSKKKNCTIQ